MKAILIDSTAREVREVEVNGLSDMQKQIGGYIEFAYELPYGDVLFVDEEGLLKGLEHWFAFSGRPDRPFAGNGLIVGREVHDADGDYIRTEDVSASAETIAKYVRFLPVEYVQSWAKANASEPSATFTYIGDDGKPHTEVLSTFGQLLDALPPSTKENEN